MATFKNGFDLTHFDSLETFRAVLLLLDASHHPTHDLENGWFKWEGSNGDLITANNPITGQYAIPNKRESEIGYASYMRLETFNEEVGKAITNYICSAADVKECTRGKARFI